LLATFTGYELGLAEATQEASGSLPVVLSFRNGCGASGTVGVALVEWIR
jgi:hypothetical protein